MSVNFFKVGFFLFLAHLLYSCSTTKKAILNKEYHTLTTKYNVLFNGKEAFSIGKEILTDAFEDNFYELLPVEPINLVGEDINETTIIPGFDRAEEKAVKAIQKHSLNIKGKQYNRQIDEAYLLLGKARYFDRRFFPALEAFNFLLESGADQANYLEGKIWREKTNIRLRNLELAIENLRPIARNLSSGNKFYAIANATLAESFLNLKQLDSAAFYIKRAAMEEPKRKNKARYLYITGQLFESLGINDSAKWAFSEIINLKRKAPKKFIVQAKIKQSLLDTTTFLSDRVIFLNKILKNYENRPYEHFVNRALGSLYLELKEDSLASVYFDLSSTSSYLDPYTQIENYQDLANYHFAEGDYLISGNYLDNLLPLFDKNSLEYKRLERKRNNLSEVITYEKIKQETDSIISLIKLSKEQQFIYFDNIIKQKRIKDSLKYQEDFQQKKYQLSNRSKASFYFYNPNQISQGRQVYLENWGNRPNVDNWRSASTILSLNIKTDSNQTSRVLEIIQEKPESYIASLPKSQKAKDSVVNVQQKAYLQLGLIYKEKFNDFPLAEKRLLKVISIDPPDDIKVQALYHLYRMNEKQNDNKAEEYKTELIENYPNTSFAKLLSNPENYDISGIITPQTLYIKALSLFKQQRFIETLDEIELLKVIASGSQIEPKISLLKAHTIGRLYGLNAWKKSLKEVATTFGAFEEGIKAKDLVDQIEKQNNLLDTRPVYENYKWIFPFKETDRDKSGEFYKLLKGIVFKKNKKWRVSLDTYNKDYIFVVVHGIRNQKNIDIWKAEGQFELSSLLKQQNFVTLTSQYQEYLKNKTWINPLK